VIDASRAYEMGLVNRVVPRADLDAMVGEFVDKLRTGPPIALATSKKLLNQSFSSTLEEALEAEGIGQAYQFTTKDTAEAMTAFVEKRFPRFLGR
jgi:enoyl-CoA hydratase/carnithine racemase